MNEHSIASESGESDRKNVFGFDFKRDLSTNSNSRGRALTYKVKPPVHGADLIHNDS